MGIKLVQKKEGESELYFFAMEGDDDVVVFGANMEERKEMSAEKFEERFVEVNELKYKK